MPTNLDDLTIACLTSEGVGGTPNPYHNDTQAYMVAARRAFNFFRRTSDSRYSSVSLMNLNRIGDALDGYRSPGLVFPTLTVATIPFRYDENTETKFGGVAGMLVTWPDGKSMLTVHSDRRGNGIGGRLITHLIRQVGSTPYFWLARTNTGAQRFLLKHDFVPAAFNSAGAIRYASTREQQSDSGDNETF